MNASVIVRSMKKQTQLTAQSTIRKENIIVMMQEKSTPERCPTSTLSVPGFLAKASQLPETERDFWIPVALSSLKLPDSLQPNGLHFFYWKTSRGCYRMTAARRCKPSFPRLLSWGIIWNGVCITANFSELPSSEGGCMLSDILDIVNAKTASVEVYEL